MEIILNALLKKKNFLKPDLLIIVYVLIFENQMHAHNIFPTFFDLSSNVLGSMFGKSFMTTGSINSINGISKNTRNGTKRNISETVRRN